jgi:hypothetical protein
MTESFTLSDLDQFALPDEVDPYNVNLHLEARFVDGSSRAFKLTYSRVWDAHQIICDLVEEDLTNRLSQLSPADKEEYDTWFDPETHLPKCTCRSCCFCYDHPGPELKQERTDALHRWTEGGVRLTWWWQPFGMTGSQMIAEGDTGEDCDAGRLIDLIEIDPFFEDNRISVGGLWGTENRHTVVTESFTLKDIDVEVDDIDQDEWYIEIREISSDGTSETYIVHDPNDLEWFLADLKSGQDGKRLSGLTPEQVERYHRFEEETECRCDGSCNEICWYDLSEQERWLDEVAPNGVDIEWVWMLGDKVRGPEGSSFLTEFNTVIDEGPGLAGVIWHQVWWG